MDRALWIALAMIACSGSSPAETSPVTTVTASVVAPWEPVDAAFKGCEGG